MDKEQAIQIVRKVCEGVNTTLEQHRIIQQALSKIDTLIEPTKEKKDAKN